MRIEMFLRVGARQRAGEGWLDAVGGQPTTGFLAIIHRKRDLDQRIGQTFHEGKVVGRNEKLDRLQPMLLNHSLDNVGRDIAEAHSEAEQRSEERSVGNECVRRCRSWLYPYI